MVVCLLGRQPVPMMLDVHPSLVGKILMRPIPLLPAARCTQTVQSLAKTPRKTYRLKRFCLLRLVTMAPRVNRLFMDALRPTCGQTLEHLLVVTK